MCLLLQQAATTWRPRPWTRSAGPRSAHTSCFRIQLGSYYWTFPAWSRHIRDTRFHLASQQAQMWPCLCWWIRRCCTETAATLQERKQRWFRFSTKPGQLWLSFGRRIECLLRTEALKCASRATGNCHQRLWLIQHGDHPAVKVLFTTWMTKVRKCF